MTAVVQLSRVHAKGDDLAPLFEVTCMLDPGLHAFIGAPVDGSAMLCEVVAGSLRPQIGAVAVAGRDPAASPAVRRRMGCLLPRDGLPDLGTVEETARRLGLSPASLEAIGAGALASRTVRSLSREESRAVELSFALARPNPVAVVLYEPFLGLGPVDLEAVTARIDALAGEAVVIFASSELAEPIAALSPSLYVLDGGRLLREEIGWPRGAAPELLVWLSSKDEARRLVARLGEDDRVEGLSLQDARVRLSAASLADAGRAVAAASEGLAVVALRSRLPSHDALVAEARRRLDERRAEARAAAGLPPEMAR